MQVRFRHKATPMGLAALWEQKDLPLIGATFFECEFDLQTQAVMCWGCFFCQEYRLS